MAIKTISSLQALEKLSKIDWKEFPIEKDLLEHYFSTGGITRISYTKSSETPISLLYPTKLRLRELIKSKSELKNNFQKKQAVWQKNLKKAESYFWENNVKKFSNPLYWKHLTKCMRDKSYKEDAEKIKLPINLVADKRWQPMIKTFLEDTDYRAQLVETVSQGIVYKNDRRVARYADSLQQFRTEESSKNLKAVEDKLEVLQKDLSALQQLMKWASQ